MQRNVLQQKPVKSPVNLSNPQSTQRENAQEQKKDIFISQSDEPSIPLYSGNKGEPEGENFLPMKDKDK